MKPYSEYKESGINWLGKIPSTWQYRLSKRIFGNRTEKARINDDQLAATQQYGVIPQKLFMENTGKKVALATKGTDGFKHCSKGDFVISLRSFEGGIEYSSYDGAVSPAYTVLYPKIIIEAEFYRYLYKSQPYIIALQSTTDSLRDGKAIRFEQFGVISSPLPPLAEQKAIAAFLDRETQKIDTLIEKQEKLITLLEEKRHALIDKSIFHEDTKTQRLKNIISKPQRWIHRDDSENYTAIGMFNNARGFFYKEEKLGKDLGDSEFQWLENGDLVFSGQFAWEGAVGLASESEHGKIASHRYPVIRGNEKIVNSSYLWALFTSQLGAMLLNEHSRGAAGRNRPLNIDTLLKEKIPVAPIEIQNEIEEFVLKERVLMKKIKEPIELLKEKRSALISAAVTGKIDVRGEV